MPLCLEYIFGILPSPPCQCLITVADDAGDGLYHLQELQYFILIGWMFENFHQSASPEQSFFLLDFRHMSQPNSPSVVFNTVLHSKSHRLIQRRPYMAFQVLLYFNFHQPELLFPYHLADIHGHQLKKKDTMSEVY